MRSSLFFPPCFLIYLFFLNGMSCLISVRSEVLVWVAESVLCATIAKEKIELSVPISSAACAFGIFFFFFFLLVCVLRCTCVHCACTEGHSCSTIIFPLHSDLYTGGPHWVSRHAELVPVWVYSRRYFICEPFFVRAPRSSAVCWQLLASLEFSKKLVCCFGLQLFKFLCQFFTLSVK